jgi:DNA-binding MurR/RpiR family transcriptional regulator
MPSIQQIGPAIRMKMPKLSEAEREVTSYLLHLGPEVGNCRITDLADRFGVSEAAVVKMAKKLDFTGFKQLKDELLQYHRLPNSELFSEISIEDDADSIVEKVFNNSIHAIRETRGILDVGALEHASELMIERKTRYFYGVAGSAAIAADACHKFLRIGLHCDTAQDPHLMVMTASMLDGTGLAFAISHSGRTLAILDAVRAAKANGAAVVALTSYPYSSLAKDADVVLCSTSMSSPWTGENAAARIAQLNILDALFILTAKRDHKRASQALTKTMTSVSGKREK